jgi:hypothetical protein
MVNFILNATATIITKYKATSQGNGVTLLSARDINLYWLTSVYLSYL